MVEELGKRLNVKLEHNYGSTSDISNPSRQLSNKERKLYVFCIATHELVTAFFSSFIPYLFTSPFGSLTVNITFFSVSFWSINSFNGN